MASVCRATSENSNYMNENKKTASILLLAASSLYLCSCPNIQHYAGDRLYLQVRRNTFSFVYLAQPIWDKNQGFSPDHTGFSQTTDKMREYSGPYALDMINQTICNIVVCN